ncbi:MFS transporter [Clostridium thailandense]|uniref:MFS transporter n=1 Tax=Clostridium thailandense TaxID=2794346 RepID=UPI0039895DC3
MSIKSNIGPRLDRLPTSKWLYKVFWMIGFGILIDGFDNYSGGVILAQLVKNGWSNNYLNAAFTSTTMIGLFFGSLFAGFSGDHWGRKVAYQVNLLIFGLATLVAAFSTNMTMIIVLRGIMGFGLGAELVVGFGTFAEFVPAKTRGKWTSTLSLLANVAPPLATLIGLIVMPSLGPNYGWRGMFVIGGVSALVLWYIRHDFPESPRWHESRGDFAKADEILTEVEKQIEKEQGIKLPIVEELEVLDSSKDVKNIPFSSLFKGILLRRTILGSCVLIAMNTAVYSITTWIPTIFVKSGITVTKSVFMTTVILFGAPLGVFIASRTVDKFSRKVMGVTLLISLAILGYIYSLQKAETLIIIIGFILIAVLYMYVCFACSVYVPELWPTEARLRGLGLCNAVGRAVTIFTPYGVAWIMTKYGSVAVFLTIGALLGIVALVIIFLGIETRQKSIEQINIETAEL